MLKTYNHNFPSIHYASIHRILCWIFCCCSRENGRKIQRNFLFYSIIFLSLEKSKRNYFLKIQFLNENYDCLWLSDRIIEWLSIGNFDFGCQVVCLTVLFLAHSFCRLLRNSECLVIWNTFWLMFDEPKTKSQPHQNYFNKRLATPNWFVLCHSHHLFINWRWREKYDGFLCKWGGKNLGLLVFTLKIYVEEYSVKIGLYIV